MAEEVEGGAELAILSDFLQHVYDEFFSSIAYNTTAFALMHVFTIGWESLCRAACYMRSGRIGANNLVHAIVALVCFLPSLYSARPDHFEEGVVIKNARRRTFMKGRGRTTSTC